MMWTLSLSLLALALGGVLKHCQFLTVLALALLNKIKRAATLVAATIIFCFTGNIALGETYISIILGGQLFIDAFDQKRHQTTSIITLTGRREHPDICTDPMDDRRRFLCVNTWGFPSWIMHPGHY